LLHLVSAFKLYHLFFRLSIKIFFFFVFFYNFFYLFLWIPSTILCLNLISVVLSALIPSSLREMAAFLYDSISNLFKI